VDRIVRRGRCVRADLGGGAFVIFVDVPADLAPETCEALNELVRVARAGIAAVRMKRGTRGKGDPVPPQG